MSGYGSIPVCPTDGGKKVYGVEGATSPNEMLSALECAMAIREPRRDFCHISHCPQPFCQTKVEPPRERRRPGNLSALRPMDKHMQTKLDLTPMPQDNKL